MHGAPDLNHRHLPAFESHDLASMGTLRIPCDIIMETFVARVGHGVGYWSPFSALQASEGKLVAGCLS
jgi:hypothetical protein